MTEEKKRYCDEMTFDRSLPTSEEVSKAAYDAERTAELVKKYRLTAVELSQLLDRLVDKPVPW